jgi:hypothetical protein
LKLPVIQRTIGSARRVVGFFNRSLIANQILKEKQTDAEGNKVSHPLNLIQDCATRWNSTYLMIKRLIELRVPIYAALFDDRCTKNSERTDLDIPDNAWQVMEAISPILKPFADATEILGKEDLPTASGIYILLHDLVTKHLALNENQNQTKIVKDLKEKILEGMIKRFKIMDDGLPSDAMLTSSPIMAASLDPRFKTLKILNEEQREVVKQALIEKVSELKNKIPKLVKVEKDEEPPNKKSTFTFDCLLGDMNDEAVDVTPEQEVSNFINEPLRGKTPLVWWKENEEKFPNLSKLAKKYLAIPATSVPSERIFSTAGLTLTKLRSTLDPETVNEIIFINKNMRHSFA